MIQQFLFIHLWLLLIVYSLGQAMFNRLILFNSVHRGHTDMLEIDGLVLENVTPLLKHWSYVFPALTHRNTIGHVFF